MLEWLFKFIFTLVIAMVVAFVYRFLFVDIFGKPEPGWWESNLLFLVFFLTAQVGARED